MFRFKCLVLSAEDSKEGPLLASALTRGLRGFLVVFLPKHHHSLRETIGDHLLKAPADRVLVLFADSVEGRLVHKRTRGMATGRQYVPSAWWQGVDRLAAVFLVGKRSLECYKRYLLDRHRLVFVGYDSDIEFHFEKAPGKKRVELLFERIGQALRDVSSRDLVHVVRNEYAKMMTYIDEHYSAERDDRLHLLLLEEQFQALRELPEPPLRL